MTGPAAVDKEKLRQKIQFIRDSVRHLEELRARGREAFLADHVLQAAAIRLLQVAIEAVVDAANHIIAREGLGLPKTYRESLEILVREKILPAEREEAFVNMVRFRNRAVHLYDEIDPAEVFSIMERRLGDFDSFISALTVRYFTEGTEG